MPPLPPAPVQDPDNGPRYFSAVELAQVQTLFDAILPGSPDSPGARDAAAADYLDLLLARDAAVYYEIPGWRKRYAAGLAALNAASLAGPTHKPLAALTQAEATALLAQLAQGALTTFPDAQSQRDFFATLRGHCIEGCLSDPRWGGNRGAVVWNWLGYPGGGAKTFARP